MVSTTRSQSEAKTGAGGSRAPTRPDRTTGERLLEAARLAPSPDNNQPWAFRPTEQPAGVEVYHVRERAVRSDAGDLFSWLAMGAAVENLVLAAGEAGFQAGVQYQSRPFEMWNGAERVASVRLHPGGEANPLAKQIPRRATNRRLQQRRAVAPRLRRALETAAGAACRVYWLTEKASLKQARGWVRRADRVRLEQRAFHQELQEALRFAETHAALSRDGLALKTLELPPGAGGLLRHLRPWRRMQRWNRWGFSRLASHLSSAVVPGSGALAVMTVNASGDEALLEAGRAMERLWLKATEAGLAVHPLGAAPLFLWKRQVEPGLFRSEHEAALAETAREMRELVGFPQSEQVVMLMRVGRAGEPSGRSRRYHIEDVVMT